jgi:hypothetical protein
MGLQNLIHLVLVVQVNTRSSQFTGDVLVKILKLFDYALYAERHLLAYVWDLTALVKRTVHIV